MKKSRKRKEWFRRVSAMIMAVALILSGITIPDGLFAVTAKAAEKLSATWTYTDTLYDSSGSETTTVQKKTGKFVNSSKDAEFAIDATATSSKFAKRDSDIQINAGTKLTFDIVKNAKMCSITLNASSEIKSSDIASDDLSDINITDLGNKSYKISGKVNDNAENVTLQLVSAKYITEISIESTTSLGVTPAAFADDTTAKWTYDYDNEKLESSGSKVTVVQNKATGTYTNANGDVLYVDTSNGGKFQPNKDETDSTKNRIQINTGTKLTIPAAKDKAVITLLISSGIKYIGTEDDLDISSYWAISGSVVKKSKCISNKKYDSKYNKVEIECYLTGDEGEITLESLVNTYIQSIAIECKELQKTTIGGTIDCAKEYPEDMEVVATNTTTGLTYSSKISDKTYSIEVPVEDDEMEYELTLSNPAYIITNGNTTHKISTSNSSAVTADLTIVNLSTCEVTGSITGFAEDYDISNLNIVFSTSDNTEYVPEVTIDKDTMTYTAKFEQGVTYSVALEGVNDYEITSKASDISYSENGTLDIEVALKPVYKVTVNMPEEPDLSNKAVTYTYVNKEDGYEYTFSNKDEIKLRNGSYTLTLGGDIVKLPYKVKSGNTVEVNGADSSHTLTFEQITSWSFVKSDDGEYYKDKIENTTGYYNGLYIDASKGKLVLNSNGNSAQFNAGTKISIPVFGKCTVSVEAYSASSALYTIGGVAASTEDATSSYRYEEKEEGTVDVVSTGSAYIKSIKVVYDAKEVEYKEQKEMPVVTGNESGLVVQPKGQRLELTQTGGDLSGKGTSISSTVSYYGFKPTADFNKISADIIVNQCGDSTNNGVFFGAYDTKKIATVGIRKGTQLKQIYYKAESEPVGSGSNITGTVDMGTPVHFEAVKTDEGLVISVTPKDSTEQQLTYKYSATELLKTDKENTSLSYGFVIAGATVTIKNMTYTAKDGTVLYDQNDCYKAEGTAPVIDKVNTTIPESREYINVNWTNKVDADGDGMYVLEVSTDNGSTWNKVDSAITDTSYVYYIKDAGSYKFRVAGKVGINGEINDYVESEAAQVIAALDKPVLNISSTAESVNITWDAVDKADMYEVYRYSYDETEENAKLIESTKECSYTDVQVEEEMPYYYYVIAYSHVNGKKDNNSNPSDVVWAMPSAGHTGEYVYESSSAGLTVTKKSYDTVYDGKITLEGVVEKAATVELNINGNTVDSQNVDVKGTFSFTDKEISEGRNDVELIITDKEGNKTRETFNYVYLTNYDKIVDAAFEGKDGDEVDGIPVYKTVQAAVNSVSTSNDKRVVILVKEGDYNEHLVVASPYITLIGEDSEKTRIFYDVKELAGGDMSERCAVRIDKTANGFTAENLTIENTYKYLGDGTKSNESADALRNDADNTVYVNVRILGYQDTLCANKGTQYYYKCYISGNVDFIYGNEPRALFNDCKLVFRYNANKNSGYVCAPKTSAEASYGLTFYNCQVLSEDGCSGNKYYLARPWGADAYITWIDCYMGKIIRANASNPYTEMSGNKVSKARFYEYGSYGPGYLVNANRRQISKKMADSMISTGYLGWDPYTAVTTVGTKYTGNIKTEVTDRYVEKEYISDTYSQTDGDDTGLYRYGLEGYAASGKTTGGGLLKEDSDNYYTVGTAEEFLDAIKSVKSSGRASVIELTADIALGNNEVENFDSYSSFITAHKNYPITHPDLIKSGVSMLKIQGMSNLTIYSKNGAKITHTCIDITGSDNIIIRNIKFDELWEWDDIDGGYDRNDWDYMTIEKGSMNIWVDHCTFYKAYDGVIDIKTPTTSSNITISWCEFLPASENNTFFNAMMDAMKANPENYEYYNHLIEEGMTHEQICHYAYGQKKTHLLGQSDEDSSAKNITVTLANNYYKDSMDRMPRLRYGTAHVYNCIMDAQNLREYRLDIQNTAGAEMAKKIVSNGASSNCGAHMLLENCYMAGMTNVLISGNGSSPAGYINAFNTIYMLDGERAELKVALNTDKEGEVALVQDKEEFLEALPYSDYILYAADELENEVQPYTGAGKLNDLTTLQWEKTEYNDTKIEHTEHKWDEGEVVKEATCTEKGIKKYVCKVCDETKEEEISETGHKYSTEWTIDKEPDCTNAGSKSHHCENCDAKTDITEIEATGHKWDDGKVTKEATCTEKGEKTYTCVICKETKTEEISETGHKYSTEWTIDKEPDCTNVGSKSHHCENCDAKTDITEIEATGHKWDDGKVTKEATCTEKGEKTYTCVICKETKTEEISETGHKYSTEWTIDKEPDCTNAGSKSHHCENCDAKTDITEIEATGHKWDDGKVTKEATCTEKGEKTYTCTICNETKTEEISETGHKYSTEWTIDKEPDCTNAGSKSHHCENCDAKKDITEIEAIGHKYSTEWTIDKAATTTEKGSKSHHCEICGDKADITEIPVIKEEVKIDITVNVEKKDGALSTEVSEPEEVMVSKVLTKEEQEKVNQGAKVKISVLVDNADNTVTENEKNLINNNLKNSQVAGKVLDIKLNAEVAGINREVHELNDNITISVTLDDALINKDSNVTRNYSILRIHNGEISELKCEFNAADNKLTFNTDRFSTYVVVYEDVVKKTEDDNKQPSTEVKDDDKKDDNTTSTEVSTSNSGDNTTSTGTSTTNSESSVSTADTMNTSRLAVMIAMLIMSMGVICVMAVRKKEDR